MNRSESHVERRLVLCFLLFIAWFPVACSTAGSGPSATPTAASQPTPTPSPTLSLSVELWTAPLRPDSERSQLLPNVVN